MYGQHLPLLKKKKEEYLDKIGFDKNEYYKYYNDISLIKNDDKNDSYDKKAKITDYIISKNLNDDEIEGYI